MSIAPSISDFQLSTLDFWSRRPKAASLTMLFLSRSKENEGGKLWDTRKMNCSVIIRVKGPARLGGAVRAEAEWLNFCSPTLDEFPKWTFIEIQQFFFQKWVGAYNIPFVEPVLKFTNWNFSLLRVRWKKWKGKAKQKLAYWKCLYINKSHFLKSMLFIEASNAHYDVGREFQLM